MKTQEFYCRMPSSVTNMSYPKLRGAEKYAITSDNDDDGLRGEGIMEEVIFQKINALQNHDRLHDGGSAFLLRNGLHNLPTS